MKLQRIIFSLPLCITLASCSLSENELTFHPATPGQNATINSFTSAPMAPAADCFDVKMEKWFTAFHYYQAKGYDMAEADKRAIEYSNIEYEKCTNNP